MYPYSASSQLVASSGFPERLIKRMDEMGCGTIELAEAADVNKETISLWRGGSQKSYTYEKVARVAAQLATTAENLLDLPAVPPEAPPPAAPPRSTVEPRRQELLRRIAEFGPVVERLSLLEEVIAEARKLSEE